LAATDRNQQQRGMQRQQKGTMTDADIHRN
jgi:hypothetical protein